MSKIPNLIEDSDITYDEAKTITDALKNDEFKKMFFDYCEEIQDPENLKKYENDLIKLEAERGVDMIFLYPEPGFVLKTSIDGKIKTFINIAKCIKIDKPNYEYGNDLKTYSKGINCNLPYAQSPSRYDYDKKNNKCLVYDVLFHPDAHNIALKNHNFKKYMIDTACSAIEREFHVKLDFTNIKILHMTFKGMRRPIVIRKLSKHSQETTSDELNLIASMMPPMPDKKHDDKPKIHLSSKIKKDEYNKPHFIIKYGRDIDLTEMTNELDSKLNLTIPKELIIEINLPMLNTVNDCILDVHIKQLYMKSEKPAKYKLNIELPFSVNDKDGTAKFDKITRKLIVRLPVSCEKLKGFKDLLRNDEQVIITRESQKNNKVCLVEEISTTIENFCDSNKNNIQDEEFKEKNKTFLDHSIFYNFPKNFHCTKINDKLNFTFHIVNVNPSSIEFMKNEKFLHVKFMSLGSGFYPVYYAFYVLFDDDEIEIREIHTEINDNDVILIIDLKNCENLKLCMIGSNESDIGKYEIIENDNEEENDKCERGDMKNFKNYEISKGSDELKVDNSDDESLYGQSEDAGKYKTNEKSDSVNDTVNQEKNYVKNQEDYEKIKNCEMFDGEKN